MKKYTEPECDIVNSPVSFINLCDQYPENKRFIFHRENDPPAFFSGKTLANKTKVLGSAIQQKIMPQEKVLILVPQGVEYIYSLMACFYANVIAIPIPFADSIAKEQLVEKIIPVLTDSQATFILTDVHLKKHLKLDQTFDAVSVLDIDELMQKKFTDTHARLQMPEDIALLLYTSGSTSQPKGVVVSHRSLLFQAQAGASQWKVDQNSLIVSWMPLFHNFGLHFGVLVPLLKKASSVILPSNSFINAPKDWFKYIDQYQASHIAAPNFAFDYCCSLIDIASVEAFSLRSLQAIICGGEPNRKETCDNFSEKFRCLGLEENVFCPHYGLSEMGAVTTKTPGSSLRYLSLDIPSLRQNKIKYSTQDSAGKSTGKYVVSCGELGEGVQLVIVDPHTCELSSSQEIGEIWIKSVSMCSGYTHQEGRINFSDVIDNTAGNIATSNIEEGGFLRTGDLGFVEDNQLFVVGREKEVMIIHGKNHHPVDVEWTIKKSLSHPALVVAVFSCEIVDQEKVVVVEEIETFDSEADYANVVKKILASVSEAHELVPYEIILVEEGSIPKTGIGKIQRKLCRSAYLNNELLILHRYRHKTATSQSVFSSEIQFESQAHPGGSNPDIANALKKDVFVPVLDVDYSVLESASMFSELGLDSILYVRISKRIEEVFNILFQPVMLFKYHSFEKLTHYLSTQIPNLENTNPEIADISLGVAPYTEKKKQVQEHVKSIQENISERDIAIIGMNCHFPGGASDPTIFWENLIQKKNCIKSVSNSRPQITTDYKKFYSGVQGACPQWGGFIDDVDTFDAGFFGISPLEAESMDPQQRKILELTWSVIESSGYNPRLLAGQDVGLFVGVHNNDYAELIASQPELMQTYGAYLDSGLHMSMISNRVSRWFNFYGPSEVINTACSSSLVAIHHAVESIHRGESSVAVAAGINLLLAPRIYLASHQAGMLAEDGRCKTFDESADGFVRAEGYGAVLLKPYSQAQKDNDTICGVIKAAAINHDGHSNSLRAPNLDSQKRLIQSVYQQSGLAPETISYIEAHGTGTSLGDPIEVQALTEAFQEIKPDLPNAFCGLGTVKTNIGHCESAAGIAGLIKVLLAMQHQTLPGILHFERLNPYISLQDSPFYIVDKTQEWKRMKSVDGHEIPRRAGISSFGFGGGNAHLVVEEYIPSHTNRHITWPLNEVKPAVIVFSAHNEECLHAYGKKLLAFIKKQLTEGKNSASNPNRNPSRNSASIDLFDMAYTLQVGREAMEKRVAFLVKDIATLIKKLSAFVQGGEKIKDCWQGDINNGKSGITLLEGDEDSQEFIRKWILKGKLDKIVQLWVQGCTIEWNLLYGQSRPRRICLPTYAFIKERYWIPKVDGGLSNIRQTIKNTIHPLLHENTSDLDEQRYSSFFCGQEFFLADHVVNGQRVLPGVAYLEMARIAVSQAAGISLESNIAINLANVVWVSPIAVGETGQEVHIGVYPKKEGQIAYEVYSLLSADNTSLVASNRTVHRVTHSQGTVELNPTMVAPVLNLQLIKTQCSQNTLSSAQCYEAYQSMGINYGPGHQGVKEIFVGRDQVLGKLYLAPFLSETLNQFVLHPSLMDSALQTMLGFMIKSDDIQLLLPFSLESLQIYDCCTPVMWVRSKYSDGISDKNKVKKFDIDLCDEAGKICVQMKGFSLRKLQSERLNSSLVQDKNNNNIHNLNSKKLKSPSPDDLLVGDVMLTPVWEPVAINKYQSDNVSDLVTAKKTVIVGTTSAVQTQLQQRFPSFDVLDIHSADDIETIVKKLEEYGVIEHIIWVAPEPFLPSLTDDVIVDSQNHGVLFCFRLIKALLVLGYGVNKLAWTVITNQAQAVKKNEALNPSHASVHGLFGVTAKEYINWNIRLLDLQAKNLFMLDELFSLPDDSQGNSWVCRERQWYRQYLIPCQLPSVDDKTVYRQGGVYVIIGGAGGIGEAWSKVMIHRYQAHIVWIGRRPLDAAIQSKLDKLAVMGPAPCYIPADATNRKALQKAYEEIKHRHGKINGVIHSAIALLDKSLAYMDENRFRAGLSAKVDVSVRMAQVFSKESLDFVLFFSSMSAFEKKPGQSNYTAGCIFKDAFAHQLSLEWRCAVKVINWGYWGSVGIVASKTYQNRMDKVGIGSLEFPEAISPLTKLLGGQLNQIALIKTTKPLVMSNLISDELMQVYPAGYNVNFQNIENYLTQSTPRSQRIKSKQSLPATEIEDVLYELLWNQLQSIGLFKDQSITIVYLEKKYSLSNANVRWLKESLRVLVERKYLHQDGEFFSVIDGNVTSSIEVAWDKWDQKKRSWLKDSNLKNQVVLVEAMLRALPDIITGKCLATDIMFPNSSMRLVEGIYKHNVVADYFNEVLADAAVAYIQERISEDPLAKISILEIGAGTGGTSAMVFSKLQPLQQHIKEYCYSDISKAFLLHAEAVYGKQNPYLRFQIFNVGVPIAGQGIGGNNYDIVIATNVLHATANIRQTLKNAKAALKSNGVILINELSDKTLFLHLTFGLLEGWWLYQDSALRIPGSPILSAKSWQQALIGEGFKSIIFPAQATRELGQQIIVAQSDGVVRQACNLTSGEGEPTDKDLKLVQQKVEIGSDSYEQLREKCAARFKKLISETLKTPLHKIDSSESLEKYGIDSIVVVQLTTALREVFDDISSTLFFEYQSIDALVEHFIKVHKDTVANWLGVEVKETESKSIEGQETQLATPKVETNNAKKTKLETIITQETTRRFQEPIPIAHKGTGPTHNSQCDTAQHDIAIIGLSGRYPQANDVNQFWENLANGKNCISEIPSDRWDWRKYYADKTSENGSIYTKWGGFITEIDKFDPLFFQISPAEAEKMDPQERLFLQEAYASIEDAGYTPDSLSVKRKVGVFVGVMNGNYPGSACFWSIANRISYLLNFQGPSMAVDTACSSSLTAIHLAIESINSGNCETAIAGGVNLIVDPVHYLNLSDMKMLSSSDQCRVFGDDADGFVDGEAVGAIVLKPLVNAIANGDNIYGVIKASMVNAGGKTNGYTVPNPSAQYQLVTESLQRARVHARAVSYIEAHGTGTALGDPIEIAGLTKAFTEVTEDKQFCAIGSVKSNIGHAESAAGIAGVTKLLLQLKHQKLVPSLHSAVLNSEINFENTPFVVQQTLADWKRPLLEIDGETKEYPRCAGISSFGAGGANAHLIIEEYIPQVQNKPQISVMPNGPVVVVLSAKNKQCLNEQAIQLLAVIEAKQVTNNDLLSIAYTLQVGRVAMNTRLAVIVNSIGDLKDKLNAYVTAQIDTGHDHMYLGEINRTTKTIHVFTSDEDLREVINKWVQRKKYNKLAALWANGLDIDWSLLYGNIRPHRISLPTYPFARERYWMVRKTATGIENKSQVLHPLLHENTSNLTEQRFSSVFSGQEFFLADHMIKGQRILPGVACLEMALAAATLAVDHTMDQATIGLKKDCSGIQLKNVVWARPAIIEDQSTPIHIGLYPEENDEISYQVYGIPEQPGADAVIHSQGSIVFRSVDIAPTLDLAVLQAQTSQQCLSASRCYDALRAMGLNYGPGFQGIEQVFVSPTQVLAKLSLPACVIASRDEFILHPSLMDSALQATIGFLIDPGEKRELESNELVLPFALQELHILGPCESNLWALIRPSESSGTEAKVQKLDIDLCDDQGLICVRMKGLATRIVKDTGTQQSGALPLKAQLMVEPYWKVQAIESIPTQAVISIDDYAQHVVILCEPGERFLSSIKRDLPRARVLSLPSHQGRLDTRYQTYVAEVFDEIQRLLSDKAKGDVLLQVVFFNRQGEKYFFNGLSGLLKTAQLETPKFVGQLIELNEDPETMSGHSVIAILRANSLRSDEQQIRYKDDKRWVASWRDVQASVTQPTATIPWRDRGVYLITGGMGGLGFIFANAIAEHADGVTLILTGRSTLSKTKQARLKKLQMLGARVEYQQVDVSQAQAVNGLINTIHKRYGALHGILHSAGVIQDNFLLKKTKAELYAVLVPKVSGLINLDEASQDSALDMFVVFSSIAAAVGNPGQGDYASANAFMDAYAGYRNKRVAASQRQGQTLSINWPLWQSGGMQIDQASETMMRQRMGLTAMPTQAGIQAFYQALATGLDQVMILHGELGQLRALLWGSQPQILSGTPVHQNTKPAPINMRQENISQQLLEEKAIAYFKRLLSSVIKLPASHIDANAPMEDYGIDSVMVMQLTFQLENTFGSLSKTLFFEYQTISALADYFLENYAAQLTELMGVDELSATSMDVITETTTAATSISASIRSRRRKSRFVSTTTTLPESGAEKETAALDIAIIGVAGRYPQAQNLEEFWENLRDGKDCITEVPKDRWDWREYYSKDRTKPGSHYSKWGGFIDDVDKFDPLFFNISPREAILIDPQERLFLEQTWIALEDAGYCRTDLQKIQGRHLPAQVGVYASVMYAEYQLFGAEASLRGDRTGFAGNLASIANRVSYVFNLHGPSMIVDSMCSGSLTALHLACQDLKYGRTDLGIAGGVNISVHPNKYLMLSKAQFISTAGHCESFGEGGDGYIPGEGVGVVLLKRFVDAQKDGDHIYAVVKGSAVNHGGKTNGYTVPNPKVQQMAITSALEEAGVDPRTVSYIEAHGTGTKLGDPIEIAGLTNAFGTNVTEKQYCSIGSVKSNIGHCESAAGMAGLTKVLLQMRHKEIVPSLHSKILNPNIDFTATPFIVNQELKHWSRPVINEKEYPRIAGISSFGAGGSNAHVVIEEYISKNRERSALRSTMRVPVLVVLSAKDEERLKVYVGRIVAYLKKADVAQPGIDLLDFAYTLQVGREAMEERLAVKVNSIQELENKLTGFLQNEDSIENLYRGQAKSNRETIAIFSSDDDMAEVIVTWIAKKKYSKLLDLWVKGLNFDWNKLYGDKKPHRISLPTYPFIRDSYWAPVVKRVESELSIPSTAHRHQVDKSKELEKTTSKPKAKSIAKPIAKPTGITLVDPLSRTEDFLSYSLIENRTRLPIQLISAASLDLNKIQDNVIAPVELYEHDKGIFEIKISDYENKNVLSESVIDGLQKSFEEIKRRDQSKVILLTGADLHFLSGGVKERQVFANKKIDCLISECEIPVIAVMKGDSVGLGWLVGALCDFMIFTEESDYQYHHAGPNLIPEATERLFICKRFGKEFGLELLYSMKSYTGEDLKSKGLSFSVLPKCEVDSYAMKMAYDLAESPRESLIQLKKHLARETHCLAKNLFNQIKITSQESRDKRFHKKNSNKDIHNVA